MSNASIIPPNREPTDWLKYFPYERRSWRRVVTESGLPKDAQQLIRKIVRKSRLMRFEKIEVTQDLISHFLDGELAGHTYPQMIANFGDPKITAQLVRRSKIRNRPVMYKALQIFGLISLAMASAYAVVWSYFHAGIPEPKTDFLAEFNDEVLELKDDEKAWTIYRPLWQKYGFSEGGGFHKNLQPLHALDEYGKHSGDLLSPGEPGWEGAIAVIEKYSDLMEGFRQGAQRPRLGVPLYADLSLYSKDDFVAMFPGRDFDTDNSRFVSGMDKDVYDIWEHAPINILLPHIQVFRSAARMFVIDTRWAVEQNDVDRTLLNLKTMIGLGRNAKDSNTLVSGLVGFAIAGMTYNMLEEILIDQPDFFAEEQLAELQETMAETDFREWLNLEPERGFVKDMIQRIYTDDGNGDGRPTSAGIRFLQQSALFMNGQSGAMPELEGYQRIVDAAQSLAEPASMFVMATRKQTTDKVDEFFDDFATNANRDFWEIDRELENKIEEFLEDNKMKHMLLNMMLPAISQVRTAMHRMIGRQEGILAAIATHRYFLANGNWPESMMDLTPDFIAELPLDNMNGNPLFITESDIGPIIYSVGPDLDDDGGKQIVNNRGNLVPAMMFGTWSADNDGDWIVWPQTKFESNGPANAESN